MLHGLDGKIAPSMNSLLFPAEKIQSDWWHSLHGGWVTIDCTVADTQFVAFHHATQFVVFHRIASLLSETVDTPITAP